MDLSKHLYTIINVFKNGLNINLDKRLNQDFFNSIIFCSTFIVLILGLPNTTYNGLASWFFKTIYPQYLEMDLLHQFNYERLIWAQVKISFCMSVPIFLLTISWASISYKINSKILFPTNAMHLFLYIYRWIFSIQFAAMLFIPLITIKIFDVTSQAALNGEKIDQVLFLMMKQEMLGLAGILVLFLFNFLYQTKKILDLIQTTPRKWYSFITQRFAFTAIIPFILGTSISSYFYNFMETDNVLNDNAFIYNSCIYIKNSSNIPSYNAIKAAIQEEDCKKYTLCSTMTDKRLMNNCMIEFYTKSKNYNFLAYNEKRDICRR